MSGRSHIKDYYVLLQADRNVSQEEIKRAYWRIARKYHPDFFPNDKSKQQKMREINEAYEVLKRQERRREYDKLFCVQLTARAVPAESKRSGLRERMLFRISGQIDHLLSRITDDTAVLLFVLAVIVGLLIFSLVPPWS